MQLVKVWDESELFEASCRPMYWYNSETSERIPYFCNSARCNRQECKDKWAKKRLAICCDLIKKLEKPRFFTLTISRDMPVAEAWDNIAIWWKKLRDKIRRWLEKLDMPKMKFFAVLEAHKDGYPHIHGFWNFYIPVKILSHMWSECAPGYIVFLEAVDDEKKATEYLYTSLGKYLGKDQSIRGARMAGHRKRTFWRSKGLRTDYELDKKVSPSDNEGWTLVKEYHHGKKEQERPDMEGTCKSVPEEGSEGCIIQMDSAEREGRPMQKAGHMHREERQDKSGDKEAQGSWSYDLYETEREIVCAQRGTVIYREFPWSGELRE